MQTPVDGNEENEQKSPDDPYHDQLLPSTERTPESEHDGGGTLETGAAWPYPPSPYAASQGNGDSPEYLDGEEEEVGAEMGFFEHLEELRWRIIKSLIALALCAGVCAFFLKFIMEEVLLGPVNRMVPRPQLQNTEVMGQITLAIQVALFSGLILSIPFITWQFWGFVKPGLYPKERKYASVIAAATIFCFLGGVAFAYFALIPTSLSFTSDFAFQGVENRFSISSYFSFVLGFIFACGAVFEMPMLSYALARFGIVTPAFLRSYRRHAAVVILIVAAIITPTPDPFNQLLLAVPLYGLYELSILVARVAIKQRVEALDEQTDDEQTDDEQSVH